MNIAEEFHNYYEKVLFEYLESQNLLTKDTDYLADLCCIALNNLPVKYVRHDVDTAFFLTRAERASMNINVSRAVKDAMDMLDHESARLSQY
ncbi:late competence development ComFB family protein [Marinomonas ostreistagni]|uniref:late competence development ComFB family protein n=1 Tax=Marinomonas ostreistagni TaxID=359209 RepID=UPI00194FD896|nr:late competence development ComFB family protein [Marinomonas ostreistagni]MBM6550162.1 late competence development ComFB family protein [Marinomonas ostreistagni]